MADTNAVVAIYDTHSAAEDAVKGLQQSGFDMKKLSVVGKDCITDEVDDCYNAADRMKYWGKWGVCGSAFFSVLGIGIVLASGPLVAWITGREGAAPIGGLSAIGAGFYSIGIPMPSVVKYETAMKAGKYLIVAHGSAADAAKAKDILSALKPSGLTEHVLEPATEAVAK